MQEPNQTIPAPPEGWQPPPFISAPPSMEEVSTAGAQAALERQQREPLRATGYRNVPVEPGMEDETVSIGTPLASTFPQQASPISGNPVHLMTTALGSWHVEAGVPLGRTRGPLLTGQPP